MWLHYKILVFPWFWKSIGKLTRSHFSDRAASKLVMLDPKEFTSFPHCLFSSSAPRHYHVDCALKLDVTKAFFSNLDQVRAARFGISFLDCSKLTVEFRIFPGCSTTIDSPAGVVCCCWMHHSFYCGPAQLTSGHCSFFLLCGTISLYRSSAMPANKHIRPQLLCRPFCLVLVLLATFLMPLKKSIAVPPGSGTLKGKFFVWANSVWVHSI